MSLSAKEQKLLDGCLAAFGEAAVYFGGPRDLNNPGRRAAPIVLSWWTSVDIASKAAGGEGLLVHGFSDLEGAEEIAPGTRIYKGGWGKPSAC